LTYQHLSYVIESLNDSDDSGDHPMGEAKRRQELALKPVSQAVTEAMG
jgi:hypothetical protein